MKTTTSENRRYSTTDLLTDWHITALSEQKYAAVKKIEINNKVEDNKCWEYAK